MQELNKSEIKNVSGGIPIWLLVLGLVVILSSDDYFITVEKPYCPVADPTC